MSKINDALKQLAEKLKKTGQAGLKEFSEGVKDAAIEAYEPLVKTSGPDLAKRYARTTLLQAELMASETLNDTHRPRDWKQIESQDASHNVQGAAILRAARLAFMANVAGIVLGVFGKAGGQLGEAISGTISDLIENIKFDDAR